MPFHGFRNYRECVTRIMKTGKSEEDAKRICGALQAKAEEIGPVQSYDPHDLSDDELQKDHVALHELWKMYQNGEKISWSPTDLIFLHGTVHEEMKKRNLEHKFIDSLDDTAVKPGVPRPEALQTPYADIEGTGKTSGPLVDEKSLLPKFKPFQIISPIVFLYGGVVRKGTEHDIDILIRGFEDDTISQRIAFRIRRMFPPDIRKRLHFIYDPLGPTVDNIPIYDLELTPRDFEKVLMSSADFTATRESGQVQLFRAVWPLKGKKGAQEQNVYDPETLTSFFVPSDYPLLVEKKYDGARTQIHCDGQNVKIFTDGGLDATARFPLTVSEVKDFGHIPFILDCEVEGWIKGRHIGREEMAGYISRNDEPSDNFVVFNVFDIIYYKEDIHQWTLEKRKDVLNSLPFKQSTAEVPDPSKSHLNRVTSYKVEDTQGLGAAVRLVAQFPASEGALIKSIHTIYELDGMTTKWVKYKTLFEVSVIVLEKIPIRGTARTFNYRMGILPFKLAKTKEEYLHRLGSEIYMYIGKSFNTDTDANPGEILSIYCDTVFKYIDRKTGEERLTLYGPEVLGKRTNVKRPATANEVYVAAREAKRIQYKDEESGATIVEESKPTYLDQVVSILSKYNLSVCELFEIPTLPLSLVDDELQDLISEEQLGSRDSVKVVAKAIFDKYQSQKFLQGMRLPITDEIKQFIFGAHWRGKSVHIDFRIKWNPTTLFGMTLDVQRAGVVTEPVSTVRDAQKWNSNPELWKINNEPGFGSADQPPKVLIEFKQAEPVEWFDYVGSVPPGRVGATRSNWGVFDIIDKGEIEILAQKPWYIELFLHGKKYDGYWIIRQMPNIWKMKPSDPERLGPRETQDFVWLIWKAKDQTTPYVLSQRAMKQQWIPDKGDSALPRHIRERLPPEYKYWEADSSDERIRIRDGLVEAMKEGKIKLLEQPSFSLHRRWFKGQTVIRRGPSQVVYDLRIQTGQGIKHYVLDYDPLTTVEVSATSGQSIDSKWFDVGRGVAEELVPGSELNPSKNTQAWTRLLDEGRVEQTNGQIQFYGRNLKGLWSLESGSGGILRFAKVS